MATRPQLHFPSPYRLPEARLERALTHETPDGAKIATYVYAPRGSSLAQTRTEGVAPVLLLHGNGEEHGIFGVVIDRICASGRAAIALDSRAQGKSTRGTAPLSYELMRDDALGALRELGVERAHVIGFSDGAIEGLLMARDQPEAVASLLSIGANVTPEGVSGDFEVERISGELESWADWWEKGEGSALPVERELLTPTPSEARRTAELLRLIANEPHIEAESLQGICCPTCVMAGENDDIDRAQTDLIHAMVSGSRLVIVPGCGHVLPKECPDLVADETLALIGRAND